MDERVHLPLEEDGLALEGGDAVVVEFEDRSAFSGCFDAEGGVLSVSLLIAHCLVINIADQCQFCVFCSICYLGGEGMLIIIDYGHLRVQKSCQKRGTPTSSGRSQTQRNRQTGSDTIWSER